MLTHPNVDKLRQLKFNGMLMALEEQLQHTNLNDLNFEERLALLLDRELICRENRRLASRLKQAKLKQQACVEDIDFKHTRGLNQAVILSLANCQWIRAHQNILFVGPSGTGKTYLACAFAHKACLEGFTTKYVRLTRLFQELTVAKGDGRYIKLMAQLAKIDVLILDDFGLNAFTAEGRRDLLEILDDRHTIKSTVVTSQLPISLWHEHIGDPTLADAILDRLVHSAHKIELSGESLRKKRAESENSLTDNTQEVNN